MIKNIITAVFLSILLLACSRETNRDLDLGMTLVDRSVDYLLKGKYNMATYSYNRSITKFRDMGSFCNMSRVAVILATIDPEGSLPLLEDARAFATIGNCTKEINIINYLSKNDYNIKELESPYKELAKFDQTGKVSYLEDIVNSSKTSDRTKSFVYRKIAETIVNENPKKAVKMIDKAIEIDSKYAWTLNLVKDEKIKLTALIMLEEPIELSEQKIRILEQALENKY